MEDIQTMEYVTLGVTLFMFATGIPPCIKMYKSGSSKNVPYIIFLLSTLSCGGMLHYGFLQENDTLVILNGVGMVLNGIYTILYLIFVKEKKQPFYELLVAIVYVNALYFYLYNFTTEEEQMDILGITSSVLTTILVCLPALEVISNIKNKNSDGMPPCMLVGGLVCGLCWLYYGILLDDPNIYSPNIPGVFITVVKLLINVIYRPRKAAVPPPPAPAPAKGKKPIKATKQKVQ